ncbi:hypothetical protein [Halomonas urumqiensis]|uniref:Uncharacterized protein n=1 Tax=Halomonas urumqiensis TaxID=1684789 RepID=A0A2N7UGR2_9GAMM|nr:hypothetical protein [Halomonas urumqiensis]PMR79601.1 hypothetical protein C1H70_11500 [Halomonas urumqiensis]PTB01051.1 hypothetical protein C6V82_17210 [Halomonas urumqiensis]GHE22874.1 hypothetical protein GCM10017767_33950 [Halomonas urumqiensis]
MRSSRGKERLIALVVLAVVLFTPPMVLLFDSPSETGISRLALYLFMAWGLVIALAAWLLEHPSEK